MTEEALKCVEALRENIEGPHKDRLKKIKNLSPVNLDETYMNEIWKTTEIRGA